MPTGAHLIFDKYDLVRRLAIGGMGEVFVARQVSDVAGFERLVILKSLLPDLAADQGFIDQFLDEARVAATLNHPNVISVFEVGASKGTYYIAMEFIPGLNLSQLRRQGAEASKPLSPQLAARIIAEAAAGLHHAHSARDVSGQPLELVHRDISPHNIMVRTDGLTKVVDFGIASAANRVTRTRTGTLKGKLAYMSPEQVGVRPLDGRSDQFSLGIVLWELLAGRRLFTGENDAKLAGAVLSAEVRPPTDGALPALDAIVLRMLDRDRERRFASCADVERALNDWLGAEKVPSDHATLSAYVKSLGGTGIDESSLTTPDDFVLELRRQGDGPRLTVEISEEALETKSSIDGAKRRRPFPLIAAAVALTGVAAVAVLIAPGLLKRTVTPSPKPVAAATPDAGSAPLEAAVVAPPPPPPPAPAPAPAKLSVSSRPMGAKLKVDGEWLGECPMTIVVAADRPHQLRLERKGFKAKELQVGAVDAGVVHEVEVYLDELPRRAAPAARGEALLSIRMLSPTEVSTLDGKRLPRDSFVNFSTTSGHHRLEVKWKDGRVTTRDLDFAPDEHIKLKLEP